MLALREKCIHPTTQKTYVKSSVGGKDNSPEGHQVSKPLLSQMYLRYTYAQSI
jgi:hypothetical protein